MAFFNALFGAGNVHHYSQAFPDARECTSTAMQKAIQDWFQLYYQTDTPEEEDPCQRIPCAVVSKLYKACFAEYKPELSGRGAKADFLTRCQKTLDRNRKKSVQLAMIGGEAWLKPLPGKDGFSWAVVRRDAASILGRDSDDQVTDMICAEQTAANNGIYTLLERRTVNPDGYLTIVNKLYWSSDSTTLGAPVALDALPKYAELPAEYTFPQPVGSIGLVSVKMPLENSVDGSMDGVSVYAAAADLIHRINHNEWLMNQEFDNGAIRVFASDDLIHKRRNSDGKVIQKELRTGLFTGLDDDPQTVGITIFAPQLREQSFLARKNEYLRNVESVLGIKRGLLCETADVQRTATEVASSEGDYSLTVQDLWEVWEKADREALRLCDVLGQMYHICPAGSFDPDKDLSISWGNGVLYDADKTWQENMQMVAAGMLKPELALAWRLKLPCKTDSDLAKIRKRYMPEMEQLLDEEDEET